MFATQSVPVISHKTTARNWGNSLGIRIPSKIAEQANIHTNEEIEMSVNEEGIIQIKALKKEKNLMDLLNMITPENKHVEQFEQPVGKELI
jgi:antitoxin MazE